MIALFTGSDYILYIQKETQEIAKLRSSRLEAMLMFEEDNITDKKVTLELKDRVDNPDGIVVEFVPKNPDDWYSIKEINISINETALHKIKERGSFGTRYNSQDKIDIYWTYYQMP